MTDWSKILQKDGDARYIIPKEFREDMRVPCVIFADENIYKHLLSDEAPQQVINVASMPGIQGFSIAMPDIHFGYGFPIGGVAAMDVADGVISPGGVGFDINCGVRLLRSDISRGDLLSRSGNLINKMFSAVPCGIGGHGDIRAKGRDLDKVLENGARWAVKNGYGDESDIECSEENGGMNSCDVEAVSQRAKERGKDQLGTLGSGNHFIEVQEVVAVYDEKAAAAMGLEVGLITIMIHSGSRGLGAQVCQDYIAVMKQAARKYGIKLPDGQLSCAPVKSEEGERYFAGMSGAANYAWANRQCLAYLVRTAFEDVFGLGASRLGLRQVYDVAHNIAKMEKHEVDGKTKELCVHRKGATRAFPAGRPELPERYRKIGQPVLVPGDMGRASFVMLGTQAALTQSWGSLCHGAGRLMSRTSANSKLRSSQVIEELHAKGVEILAKDKKTITEEAPQAYKDVTQVVDSCMKAGLATKVARMKPLLVIKG